MSRAGRGAGWDEPAAPRPGTEGVLVIGYGNPLRSDDGVGPGVAALLSADPRLEGVEVLARHQLSPELALGLAAASLVILIDADVRGAPGAVRVQRLGAAGEAPAATSASPGAATHHVDVEQLLALAAELGGRRPAAAVVSIGVSSLELGEQLSRPVEGALPEAVDAVVGLVAGHRTDR